MEKNAFNPTLKQSNLFHELILMRRCNIDEAKNTENLKFLLHFHICSYPHSCPHPINIQVCWFCWKQQKRRDWTRTHKWIQWTVFAFSPHPLAFPFITWIIIYFFREKLCSTTWARASLSVTRVWLSRESRDPTLVSTLVTCSIQRGRGSPMQSVSPSNVSFIIFSNVPNHKCLMNSTLILLS